MYSKINMTRYTIILHCLGLSTNKNVILTNLAQFNPIIGWWVENGGKGFKIPKSLINQLIFHFTTYNLPKC